MKQWIIENLYSIIVTIGLPLVTYIFSKRKFEGKELKTQDVIIESNQSDVVSKNLDLYQRMLDDIEKRYIEKIDKSDKENEELELEIEELKKTIKELEEKLKTLSNEIINLKGRLEKFQNLK